MTGKTVRITKDNFKIINFSDKELTLCLNQKESTKEISSQINLMAKAGYPTMEISILEIGLQARSKDREL